jgi:S1-C subfamily serine protease
MNKLKLLAPFSGLLLLCAFTLYFCSGELKTFGGNNISQTQNKPHQLSVKQLRDQAAAITVRVMSQDFLGSGIIFKREGSNYTVLTNAHVLRAGDKPYQIQTPDGCIHSANFPKNVEILHTKSLQTNDLAILQFKSTNKSYQVASLGTSPKVGDEVFAAGFPFVEETQDQKFVFTNGKVSLVLPKALEGGYQIGYTNNIKRGMSGGPLLNRQGELIGVNGMYAYPLWDAPSMFADGSQTNKDLHEKIVRLSFAVPIDTVMRVIQEGFRDSYDISESIKEKKYLEL